MSKLHYFRVVRTCLFELREQTYRHTCMTQIPVAPFRGAGGSADPPPKIVKCKSFALSVSSKGSLYISHNGR